MKRNEIQGKSFENLGISPGLLTRVQSLGFHSPTPIQNKAIPIANSGRDVVGIAQTGSGKTLAFALPTLQKVSETEKMGLILLPTRELAVQVEETFKKVTKGAGLRTALIIGGVNARPQERQLNNHPHVIIATPGRLIDHIGRRNISMKNIGILVLDEADRMLDMGFEPQLKQILEFMPKDRQTMLFSATMPDAIANIAHKYMYDPVRIQVTAPGTPVHKIDQKIFIVQKKDKTHLLLKLLKEYSGQVLVFSRTKHGAKKIARDLRQAGLAADEIHSNRTQNQRQSALKGFSNRRFRIMVATDIAARGIDVDDIELVLNYDLPDQIDDYVHRIGRTARAGKSGTAISFATPDQRRDIQKIQRLIKMEIPVRKINGQSVVDTPKKQQQGQGKSQNTKSSPAKRKYKYKPGRGKKSNRPGRKQFQARNKRRPTKRRVRK